MLNAATVFLQSLTARDISARLLIVFVMARCKLCPKQVMLRHSLFLHAFTMLAVTATNFASSGFLSLNISSMQFAICSVNEG